MARPLDRPKAQTVTATKVPGLDCGGNPDVCAYVDCTCGNSDAVKPSAATRSRWQSYLEGPRGAFGVSTIYDLAALYKLTVESVEEHKGLLTKTVTFTLTGPSNRIQAAQRHAAKAIKEWNGD